MNESDRAITLAGVEQWVVNCLLVAPAHLALHVLFFCVLHDAAVNLDGLFLLEIVITVNVIGILVHVAAVRLLDGRAASTLFNINVSRLRACSEVLDGELETAQFYGVALAQLVIAHVLLG